MTVSQPEFEALTRDMNNLSYKVLRAALKLRLNDALIGELKAIASATDKVVDA